jgi:hypothetical protein
LLLAGFGDVTLRGQHQPGPAADVWLGGGCLARLAGDATLLATHQNTA